VASKFEIVVLDGDQFQKAYELAWSEVSYDQGFTKEMHAAEFRQFDRSLREELGRFWKGDFCGQGEDFALMDEGEWSGKWHHSCGIYSNRICCGLYVTTILDVLRALPHGPLWTYHTAIEIWEEPPVLEGGEFFLRDGKMFILPPLEGEDYERVFHRTA